jgi:hypothetical protein
MLEEIRNGDNGQKTDRKKREPVTATYVDIVKKGQNLLNRMSGLKVRGARAPLTFLK